MDRKKHNQKLSIIFNKMNETLLEEGFFKSLTYSYEKKNIKEYVIEDLFFTENLGKTG